EINKKTAEIINNRKGKLFVCGTTALRCLETAADKKGKIEAIKGTTKLFVYPPYKFKLKFDALITNFHLPKSTLLMLVMAVAGRDKIFEVYETAIREKYRFFSFGDAMLILR
ncbi:S-adenosylmethionine:tRNA ribosyltransferase-isomerase, partial [Candidatus Woesearchaeota archaeon]|nr:S-adenosylmethionine:tRNA ribosyltransferase-isomerase [Candidatus Woesearchaeota archaeon]